MSLVVSDTSPLRAMSHLRLESLPHQLYGRVLIPPSVASELREPLQGQSALDPSSFPGLEIVVPVDQVRVDGLRMRLDPGESEAIALAEQFHADLLIDERRGRKVAREIGLKITGTLGVLLLAKYEGRIPRVAPLLESLERDLQFYMHPSLRDRVLKDAGEG